MENRGKRRRILGTILAVVGVVLLLGAGIYLVQSEAQGAELRSQLRASELVVTTKPEATPAVAQAATVVEKSTATEEAAATPTLPPPTAAETVVTDTASAASEAQAESEVAALTVAASAAAATQAPAATAANVAAAKQAAPTSAVVAQASGQEPARLVIPDLKIDTKVVPMGWKVVKTKSGQASEWQIPKNEAGHHINSAQLGQPGNLVISGHNNIYARVFMKISQAWDNDTRVKVDDFTDRSDILTGREIMLYDAAGNEHRYTITDFYRLKDTGVSLQQRIANGRFIQPTDDTRLTIVTCWPPTNNTHRLVVVAVPAQ